MRPNCGVINGHEWVDMGLSVKWATCNIGASSPSESGDYFSWGETESKSKYTWFPIQVGGPKNSIVRMLDVIGLRPLREISHTMHMA